MKATVMWLQNSLGVDVTGEWARDVHLNVGGTPYTTRRHTLRALKDHRIFGPIVDGRGHRCEDGSFLIDRDGPLFRYVLAFLRDGRLTVPENFNEWEMLLQEVRFFDLPEMEEAVLCRFEYQRSAFRRQLPHGVYVWWPPVQQQPQTRSASGTAAGPRASAASATAPAAPLSPPSSSSPASPSSDAVGRPRHPEGSKDTAAAPPPPPAAAFESAVSSMCVRIVPPLPGLAVEMSETGPRVRFRETEVLHDLDQLVAVLLAAYGFTVQHWDDVQGRVLLSLPGPM
ncbi:BTB/POZ domain containing protein [Novymonas esmeraldas]|uniref:BTB/POZ domain containing protein n=1 Tax=Novymonas esmeraldas TaxID=1808958 RepID=A0AAW0EYF1_9TRYP